MGMFKGCVFSIAEAVLVQTGAEQEEQTVSPALQIFGKIFTQEKLVPAARGHFHDP